MQRAFLLVAHGSRRDASNQEIFELVAQLHDRFDDRYEQVDCAFLEMVKPDVVTQLEKQIAQGATSIAIFPYFLAAGTHVQKDLPLLVDQIAKQNPHCHFHLHEHLGQLPELVSLIYQSVCSSDG